MKKVLLVVVCLMLLVMTFVGCSFEPVAKADEITETNGYYTFKMSRICIPVVYTRTVNIVGESTKYQLGVVSVAFNIQDMVNSSAVYLSTYFWTGDFTTATGALEIDRADPYTSSYSFTRNFIHYVDLSLVDPSSNSASTSLLTRYAVFISNGFFANVESIELGYSYDNNLDNVFNADIKGSFDTNFAGRWTYVKMNSINGGYAIFCFQTATNDITDANIANSASFPYRKYYLNLQTDNELYQEAFDKGKNEGFIAGSQVNNEYEYNRGYDDGERDGYDQAIRDNVADYSTFGGWANAVLSLLDVKIFGAFGLRELLAVAVGGAILAFVIKLIR